MESAHDIGLSEVLECDELFFTALLRADHDLLGVVLADDFVIVDVLSGQGRQPGRTPRRDQLGAAAVR